MKRALVTIAIGDHCKVHKLTHPRMAEYAALLDAEYVIIRETKRKPAHFAKFDLLTAMADQGFDKILYVDADIYIKQAAPNIFDYYTAAAFSEIPHPRPDWVAKPVQWIRDNLVPDWPADRYFNTGVMVISGDHLKSLAELVRDAVPRQGVYYEQDQLNVLMREAGFPQERLDQKWNQFCGPQWITPERAAEAYFLHGTGIDHCDKKLRLLERFAREYP